MERKLLGGVGCWSFICVFAGVVLSVWFPFLWKIPVTASIVFAFCLAMLTILGIYDQVKKDQKQD